MSGNAEIILGMDLGTTYSTAAAVIGGRLYLVPDGRGEVCVPSVVHFPRHGPPVVGAEAERARVTDPLDTVFGIKRIIGRGVDSPAARLLDACAAFRLKGSPGAEASVQLSTGTYAASEVAAIILRYLRERAEARFGRKITKAVLTIPVTAGPEVHAAMLRCGRMAGLEVLRIVSEPCAGAIALGAAAAPGGFAPVMVYDFGGGTLDVTVLHKQGPALQVLSAGGDDCLGGDDFDLAFAKWIAEGVYVEHGVDVTKDAVTWARVQRQCEMVKRVLSTSLEARFLVKDAFSAGGRTFHIDYPARRDHLVPHWKELVQRSLVAAEQSVRDAGVPREGLGGVLLIGGTTNIPLVRAGVEQVFPGPCAMESDPQTSVARGAAVLAVQPHLLAA